MSSKQSGTLITCDIQTRELIMLFDEDREIGGFVLEQLDETHLFIDSAFVEKLKEKLKEHFDQHVYKAIK